MMSELPIKLRDGHPDFTNDRRFQYFYLNRLKWTEAIALMLAELEDEDQILRIIRLALEVDLMLGARLAGSVKPQFQSKTVGMIYALEISDRERVVDLLGLTRSDAAIPGLLDAIERGRYQHYEHALNIQAVRVLGSFGTESTIPGLVIALQDRDGDVREWAAHSLEKIGGNLVVTSLLEALNYECEYVRINIIRTLGKLGDLAAIPELIQALEHDSSDYRNVAAEAAEALGKLSAIDAVPALIHALDDEIYYDLYKNAIAALGKIGGEAAIAALTKALSSSKEYLQIEAATALAKLGDPVATSMLVDALKTSNNQNYLIELLGEVNSDTAILAIIDALENQNSSDRAAEVLGKLGNRIAIPALKKAVMSGDHYSRSKAVEALGNLGSESDVSFVIDVFDRDKNAIVRSSAVRALRKLGGRVAIPALIHTLTDKNSRATAIEELGKLGDEALIPALIHARTDEDYQVRSRAAEALGKLDSEAVIPALIEALLDKDHWVRYRAVEGLSKFSEHNDNVTKALINALSDNYPPVSKRAAHGLGFYNRELENLNIDGSATNFD